MRLSELQDCRTHGRPVLPMLAGTAATATAALELTVHLATAVRLGDAISSILTFDNELAVAAARNGIPAAYP